MDNQLSKVVKQSGLSQESKINELMKSFTGYFQQAKEISQSAKDIVVTDESQIDLIQEARGKRLELKRIRVEAEKTRKELKEQSLREGRAIDGVANVIKALIVPVEEHLEKQEKFAEILEQQRLEKRLNNRMEKLSKYIEDVSLFNLKDMEEDAFEKLLGNSKQAYETNLEAERKAEEESLEREKKEREEQERIRRENEELKKEAEEKEKKLAQERKEQEAKLEAERKKREELENRIKAEKEEQEHKEREARLAEEAMKRAEEEKKRQDLLAPDQEKLIRVACELENYKFPAVERNEAREVILELQKQFARLSGYTRQKAKNL